MNGTHGLPDTPTLTNVCQALEKLTGFQIRMEPSNHESFNDLTNDDQMAAHESGLISVNSINDSADEKFDETTALVRSIEQLVQELLTTQATLADRESELAAGIPVVMKENDSAHLKSRLQSVLRGICDGLECQAAAAYLLDDATTALKLRAQWGLPNSRFVQSARPLRGAVADLEALTGNAVVIEDTSRLPHWNVPEDFASAVCVPIASTSTILGTLWIYCDQCRDFSPRETNLIEIASGKIASDLERSVLLQESKQAKKFEKLEAELVQWEQQRLLLVPPKVAGWEIVGGVTNEYSLHQDFYFWNQVNDKSLSFAAGGATGSGGSAVLSSTAFLANVQMLLAQPMPPCELLNQLNDFAWMTSPGNNYGSLFCAMIHHKASYMTFATAGTSDAYVLRPHGWEPLSQESMMLGIDPDSDYESEQVKIADGDVVFAVSERGFESDLPIDTTALAEILLCHTHRSARSIADLALERLARNSTSPKSPAVVVVKKQEN